MAESLIEGGVKIEGINFWVHGTRAARAPFRRIGEGLTPYPFVLVYPQDAHERLLIESLGALGVRVERRTVLTRLDPHADGVRAALTLPDGTEEVCDAPYLAGCDGASSAVRELLGIGFPGGTYSGAYYVADVEASGPATDGEIHIDLEEADFGLLFPLRGKGRVRLVGLVREPDDRDPGGSPSTTSREGRSAP
jgi:2-polyprenyl-6-methoxyphenol hydroxylase-like FAD-dependent oxidoreductase